MLILVALLGLLHLTLSVNPGLKLRVTQNALNYAATQAINSLHLVGQTIDDIHGSDDVSVGKVDYDITGARVNSFTTPQSSLQVATAMGIEWKVTGCSAQLSGDWHYHYKWGFISIKDSGSFDMDIVNVNIIIKATLGRDSTGNLNIRSTGCTSSVGDVKVDIHGGLAWLYNIFDDQIDDAIKKQLNNIMCEKATDAINVDAEKALAKAKLILPIHNTGVLNYSLLVDPIFATEYLDTHHKGEIFWFGSHQEAPFTPAAFPESFHSGKMVYIWISDYLINTAGYVLQNQGIMKFFLQPSDLPLQSRYMLNTTCPNKVCIGNFLLKVQDEFPGCAMALNMSTSKAPTLTISENKIYGKFEGDIAYFVSLPNGTNRYTFNTHLMANVSLSVKLIGSNITAKVIDIKSVVNVTDSTIGKISSDALTWSFQNLLTPQFLIPQFDAIGAQGFRLPSTDQISFINPNLTLIEDALVLSTDLKWIPNFNRRDKEQKQDNTLYYSGKTVTKKSPKSAKILNSILHKFK